MHLCVCLQNNLKTYEQILMEFSGNVNKMAEGRDDLILLVIEITMWIQEFL